jgi:hypothetical protein
VKSSRLVLAAVLLAAAVIIAAVEIHTPDCSRPPHWHWFTVLFFSCGPLSVAALLAGLLGYMLKKGANAVVAILGALVVSGVWAAVGTFIVAGILLSPGCLS